MTENNAVVVENLSKAYQLGNIGFKSFARSLKHRLTGHDPFEDFDPDARQQGNTFWALKDINFTVPKGEVVGIIGRNGAGKSTLLKILSRVTEPTSGRAVLNGRVASLLEVGTGFHPELTGRENVYLSGSFFGMKKAEIADKFDSIVEFSEVGRFIETPVKRYSSGMYVRLAFAVAAHLDPDILIVDEVLAVGDAAFQKKCIGRMGDVAHAGRTVLVVSHNMGSIKSLCDKVIWIDEGRLQSYDDTDTVVHSYLSWGVSSSDKGKMELKEWAHRYGEGGSRIVKAMIKNDAGECTSLVFRGSRVRIAFDIQTKKSAHNVRLSALVVADSGEKLLLLSNYDSKKDPIGTLNGLQTASFEIDALPLSAGDYSLTLGIHSDSSGVPIDVVTNVLPFKVEDMRKSPRPFHTSSRHSFCCTKSQFGLTR